MPFVQYIVHAVKPLRFGHNFETACSVSAVFVDHNFMHDGILLSTFVIANDACYEKLEY